MLLTDSNHHLSHQHKLLSRQQQQQQTLSAHDTARYTDRIQRQHQQAQQSARLSSAAQFQDSSALPLEIDQTLPADFDLDIDLGGPESLSSSPLSTFSVLSHFSGLQNPPLSPAFSTSQRDAFVAQTLGELNDTADTSSFWLSPDTDTMMHHADASWLVPGQMAPKSASRFSHQRETSLSSLGSTGPASPYSQNSSNPQIAVTDTAPETYHGLAAQDDYHYRLAASKLPTDHFYGYANYGAPATVNNAATSAYLAAVSSNPRGLNRGHLSHPDFPIGQHKSQTASVASSVNSESPATPSLMEPGEDDRRRSRNHAQHLPNAVPKLARTMTDVYNDELYSPNFTITSAAPSQSSQTVLSPANDVFAQRLQAANSQHLNAAHSPSSSVSRGRSPFQQGSPHAPRPSHEFPSSVAMRFGSAQRTRDQNRAEMDAHALHQQIVRGSDSSSTPQTISPKDALLEFHDAVGDNNFPLFPPENNSNAINNDPMSRAMAQANHSFSGLGFDEAAFDNMHTDLVSGVTIPQQYPFVAHARQPAGNNNAMSMMQSLPSGMGSMESSSTESIQRPGGGIGAESGTYTCTYHGCTLRFETPALLQKHKREGHRQAHGLNTARRSDITVSTTASSPVSAGMTSSFLNSQAGPHKCERINPGTGKPCNTIFSRPYDLTRHEDTIHNARKQKVRCDLCTDDKTFSRADALTRHYRVCHPDVEFPGKHRRRGGRSG